MLIGLDASRAFLKNRTGIEEYSYQTIKHLTKYLGNSQVVLYIRKNQESRIKNQEFPLPEKWEVKVIKFPYLWTQLGLSLELLLHPVDVLFVPAHTVPFIHPDNTLVTIHGLEYEFCPKAYSWWERFYMRVSIKNSCRWAKTIIAVSENTKKDLISLYGIAEDKIRIIYEGYDNSNSEFPISNFESKNNLEFSNSKIESKFKIQNSKFLLFIGRLEERKNICGIISAFETLKEKYNISHKLILAGSQGYGYEKIKSQISKSKNQADIILTGFVSKEEKWDLIKNADVFLFTTQYEGFGLPILEAQSQNVPVVASNNSSIPEVANGSAVLVDPNNNEEIVWAAYNLISDKDLRDDIIKKGQENVKRFSWEKCASEIAELLIDENIKTN
jgi:glycosyltransferase involved in cell wall biosynthesis